MIGCKKPNPTYPGILADNSKLRGINLTGQRMVTYVLLLRRK